MAWQPLIRDEATGKKSPLEAEDKVQIASLGLLYAIRTYQIGMRAFEDYARDCIRAYLTFFDRQYRRSKRAESSLSLDAPLNIDGTTATYGDYLLRYEEPAFFFDVESEDQPNGQSSDWE